jgi:hypothetical protein
MCLSYSKILTVVYQNLALTVLDAEGCCDRDREMASNEDDRYLAWTVLYVASTVLLTGLDCLIGLDCLVDCFTLRVSYPRLRGGFQ